MKRMGLLAALLFGWGAPDFDGHRPAALDRTLQQFHRSLATGAASLGGTIGGFDGLRALPAIIASLRRLNGAF